jgi:glutathione S-transferase
VFHPEKVPSAQERYGHEIKRVVGVLNRHLKGKTWLVGDKCTYAVLAFVMWNAWIPFALGETNGDGPIEVRLEQFPEFVRWQNAMLARPSLQKMMRIWQNKDIRSDGTR